jgi:outer membrane protein TolC
MKAARYQWTSAVATVLGIVAAAVCYATMGNAEPALAPVPHAEGKQDRVKELQQERLATCREIVKQVETRYKNGQGNYDELHEASRMVLAAELELCTSDKERVAVLEKFLPEAKKYEAMAEALFKAGQGTQTSMLKARAERLRVEIDLERAKAKSAQR